ncbi:MAG: aminoglycoside phosphotransferase family protein [Candidatus Latescibacteria bacterium]|nr:aminoglycoside phosphotransferase family protein [Candidatus Latescibacterota bacterium]
MTLDKKNIAIYLRRKKLLVAGDPVPNVTPLGDGLQHLVFQVAVPRQEWIVKQALARAQVKERWWLDRRRIFNEKNCLEILAQLFPVLIPEVVLEDRTDFILVTTAQPREAVLWEDELMGGKIDLQIASQCGELLATVHNQTADDREVKTLFKDTKPFEQLRIEPFYGRIAQVFPDLKKPIEAQIRQLLKNRYTLVLGDLRPRNVYVNSGQVYLVDFVAAHYGNPAFDLALYASDMCLKAMINSPQKAAYLEGINIFWNSYFRTAEYAKKKEVEKSAVRDLSCLLLSSIDGRLPAAGLDEHMRGLARRIAQNLLFTELDRIEEITEFVNRTLIDG